MKIEYAGTIMEVRAVEDCIRATRKYTKGVLAKPRSHPIQGEEFPSHVFTEYYEVYPGMEVGWDMAAVDAWAWVWGDVPHIDMRFHYDYNRNKARITITGHHKTIKSLGKGVEGYDGAVSLLHQNGRSSKTDVVATEVSQEAGT